MKLYITFGFVHKHEIAGKVFDCTTVAEITCDHWQHGRKKAFELFDDKWAFDYPASKLPALKKKYKIVNTDDLFPEDETSC